MPIKTIKTNKVKINADQIFTHDDSTKNYIVFYTISYDEPYYADDVSELFHKCFKYEYTEIIATSAENAVEIVKEILPVRLKETALFNFFRDKKNVKLHSIEGVYVQTIQERELV